MPRYFFNISDGIKARDAGGIMLADESAARAHAQALASAIVDRVRRDENDAGEQVLELPVRAAERN
jgi:hypothetical protein